jgi:hypothetical protein
MWIGFKVSTPAANLGLPNLSDFSKLRQLEEE